MRRCRMKSPAARPKTEIAPARNKVAGRMPPSAGVVLEGNVVSLQLLEVLSGESIVAQQLVVAPEWVCTEPFCMSATSSRYAASLDPSEAEYPARWQRRICREHHHQTLERARRRPLQGLPSGFNLLPPHFEIASNQLRSLPHCFFRTVSFSQTSEIQSKGSRGDANPLMQQAIFSIWRLYP